MISPAEIAKIAELARLELTAEEMEKYARELSDILDFFEQLKEVDTTNVKPTAQITGLTNILREDLIERELESEKLLQCSPHTIQEQQIQVPNVF
jgi:aspartyl-tRNA(Asn)/glutamyl-tRNA(Gln) amidotransferase subunit C